MARHRGRSGIRGVSTAPLVLVVALVLLVVAVLGWMRLRDNSDRQAQQAAQTCVEGDRVLPVAADPAIAPALTALASRWTEDTRRVVRDHCITVSVEPVDPGAAAHSLAQGTWSPELGPEPGLWVPIDSALLAGVDTNGPARSIATSPVVLATSDASPLRDGTPGWSDLPAAVTHGDLRLALPDGPLSRPTVFAMESVAASVAGGALTMDGVRSPAVTTALSTLATAADTVPDAPSTTDAALDALAAAPGPDASLTAVAALEQQVAARSAAGAPLVAVAPHGPTVVADFPAAVVSAPWVDETLSRAAAEFSGYLRDADRAATLREAGFRIGSERPDSTDTVAFADIEAPLEPVSGDTAEAVHDLRTHPFTTRTVEIVLDRGTDASRVSPATTALRDLLGRLPDATSLGLVVTSGSGRAADLPPEALAPTPLTPPHRDALDAALGDVPAARTVGTTAALSAAGTALEGTEGAILLVTTDSTLAVPSGVGTRVDVVLVGDEQSADGPLASTARATGGTVTAVSPGDPHALEAAFRDALA